MKYAAGNKLLLEKLREDLDAKYGFPCPGVNAATGLPDEAYPTETYAKAEMDEEIGDFCLKLETVEDEKLMSKDLEIFEKAKPEIVAEEVVLDRPEVIVGPDGKLIVLDGKNE